MSADDTGWVRPPSAAISAKARCSGSIVAGHEIALYDVDGDVFATDDICTHAYARLSDGWLDNGEIECPLHAGRFDVAHRKGARPARRPTT